MSVQTQYGQCEPGFGFLQIPGMAKATGGGTGMSTGDTIVYNRTNNNWEKAVAGSLKPLGFLGDLQILTQTLDVLSGVTTSTKGASDAQAKISVVVGGRITKIAGAAIPAGELVMPDSADPVKKVMEWNGTNPKAILGRYVLNVTNHTDADNVPAAALNDEIKIQIDEALGSGTT